VRRLAVNGHSIVAAGLPPSISILNPGGILGGSSGPPLGLQSGQGMPGAPQRHGREVAPLSQAQLHKRDVKFLVISCHLPGTKALVADNSVCLLRIGGSIMKSPGRRGVTAIDKYIGHRLRTQRLILNMTQTDIAKVIGVTFQQLQKYEKGTNRITASTLQKLAAAMKVPITYFLKNAPCEHADQNDSEMAWTQLLATPDGLALFRAFRGIESKSLRRAVVNLVEGMGKERTIISPAE